MSSRNVSRNTSTNRFLRPVFVFFGLVNLALKRLFYRPGLTVLAVASITLAIGLVSSAGFFSQAVDRAVLGQELVKFAQQTGRPPFSMRVYFLPSSDVPLTLEATERLTSHVAGTLEREIGLPTKYAAVEVESGAMMLHRLQGANAAEKQLGSVNLVYFQDVADHIDIEGDPMVGERSGDVLDVWLPTEFAAKAGANVGDTYAISHFPDPEQIKVRVAGTWEPQDPTEPYWFTDPDLSLNDGLLIRRQDYIERIQPRIPAGTRFASWHVQLDPEKVRPGNARQYLDGLQNSKQALSRLLPEIRIDVSPIKPLEQFVTRSSTLMIVLLGFNIPALGFLLYFLALTSGIIARWQRRETSILVSRGATVPSILSITLVEQLLLFAVGLPLGLLAGLAIARFMGNASSFLTFVPRAPLPVSLDGLNLALVAATMVVVLITRLWASASAARHSNVEEEREQARPMRKPFWYRYYLDLLLIIPAAYGYKLLVQQGSLAMLVKDRPSDLYQDPLLILLPALFTLVAALLAMRIFPLILRGMDALAKVVPWITPHLALQQLGRQSQAYINPLLLIIVCLALGVYTFSLAGSLDKWLEDRLYYQVGTDVTFKPIEPMEGGEGATEVVPVILPMVEYLKLPGVAQGTEVGDFAARVSLANGPQVRGRFLAVDQLDFRRVSWFRRDFADEPLGGLMNLLAKQQDGVLLPQEVLEKGGLEIGDQVRIAISVESGVSIDAPFTIVGTYTYFPTVYEDRPTAIGNLGYVTYNYDAPLATSVWLKLEPGADGAAVLEAVKDMGVEPSLARNTVGLIAQERAKTERVGVFGTLSVGFIAAAVMAFAGLLINTYASLNDRLYRFTILHAIGLQRRQILGQVFLEYMFLTAYGAAAGAFIGMQVSKLFSPLFRITGARQIVLPPLIPILAQDQIASMAIAFALLMIVLELGIIGSALYRRFFRQATGLRNQGF
jgi:putative ABC transport system permease protein